ncbi:MAG: RNA methyltransferase [Bacteroidales bacterium]|nr:RNA methyltransferase [Bacteroidales bacterium]
MRKLKNSELKRLTIEDYIKSKKIPIIIVLDNVRSLLNVGSIFRTADAFKIESIYLCGITGKPPHREINKTALGATESVLWQYFKTTLEAVNHLIKMNYKIIAIEQVEKSITLNNYQVNNKLKYALIFGNEVEGIDQEIVYKCDDFIEIPQYGTKHSLNIAVSVGIVIWDFFNKIKKG